MLETPPIVDVSLLVLPESFPGALYSLHELFGQAGRCWQPITGEPEAARCRFAPRLVSVAGIPQPSPAGPVISVEAPLHATPEPDIVIVTDLGLEPGLAPRGRWPEEAAWLRRVHANGAVVCSVCSGSVFIAEAGLLDDLESTTHWAFAGLVREHYPRVRLRPERILCPAGEGHRIVTAGGASTWSELGLYLVARFAGEAEARRLAKVFVIGDKSDGQLPFAAMARPRQHADRAIERAQLWIADNYATAHPASRMASVAGLPERTFSRRFRKATGYGPLEYVQTLRLEEAKQMLEVSDEPIDSIALAVGYGDPASFRSIFKRGVGITPTRYRQRFARLPGFRDAGGLRSA